MRPARAARAALHFLAIVVLTILTQVGGACYAAGLAAAARRSARTGILAGLILYGALTLGVLPSVAPHWGRVALPCGLAGTASPAAISLLYCALNRHYGTPEVAAAMQRIAGAMDRRHPGTVVTYLDAGFPLPVQMPLLPHLSHRDGRAIDLALFYNGRARAGAWPVGYFAFAPAASGEARVCSRPGPLRWSFDWLQPLFADTRLDHRRTADLVLLAIAEPAVSRVLLHPGLASGLGISSGKLRFAGCHAARHDDHLHLVIGPPG